MIYGLKLAAGPLLTGMPPLPPQGRHRGWGGIVSAKCMLPILRHIP